MTTQPDMAAEGRRSALRESRVNYDIGRSSTAETSIRNISESGGSRCLMLKAQGGPGEGFVRVENPAAPYDALLVLDTDNSQQARAEIADIVAVGSNPAAPLLAAWNCVDLAADFDLPDASPFSISAALMMAQPLIRRVAALPPIPRGRDRSRLVALAIAYTRDIGLDAAWSPDSRSMVGYPRLAGIADPRLILEDLANEALLRRRYFDQAFVCAQCESSRLIAREVCVACHSSHIEKQSLLHHYPCGFQGAQSLFAGAAAGGYVCPKCNKQLRHYGVDYDKPGAIYECRACVDVMSEPDVYFICTDCNYEQPSDGAARRIWHHYDITPDGVAAVQTGVLSRGGDAAEGGIRSLRDFRILTQQMLTFATRHARPVSAFRMQIGAAQTGPSSTPSLDDETRRFMEQIAAEGLTDADIVAVVNDSVVVCLPETDAAAAARIAGAIRDAIEKVVRRPLPLQFEFYNGSDIVMLLGSLR